MSVLGPQPPGIPTPRPSVHAEAYWEGCRRHELLFQRCAACGHSGLRAFTVCAACLAAEPVWVRSSGSATLYSWTVVWRAPSPAFSVPYAPAVVLLEEGVWMVSAVIGCTPEDLRDAMALAVEFHPASDEIVLPYFAPAGL